MLPFCYTPVTGGERKFLRGNFAGAMKKRAELAENKINRTGQLFEVSSVKLQAQAWGLCV